MAGVDDFEYDDDDDRAYQASDAYEDDYSEDDYGYGDAPRRQGALTTFVNWTGAVVSLGLVVGLGVWGYQLAVRDVSGVPVIRAMEGPARVAPEEPGGRQADHQGLAVNQVAAEGSAAPPADQLLLAPKPVDLAAEDKPQPELQPRSSIATITATPDAEAEVDVDVAALPEPIPEEVDAAPVLVLPEGVPDPATLTGTDAAVAAALALVQEVTRDEAPFTEPPLGEQAATSTEDGVARSLRPRPRPVAIELANVSSSGTQLAALDPATAPVSEVDPAAVPVGTAMVQLGAFDSAEVARAEWQRLSGRFDSFMAGKSRVVQSAVQGGRTFYRLRAIGFDDLSDARRFCAALTAENADCIPAVAR